MVRVVVGDEQGFAEDGLAVSPGNFCEQISLRIADQFFHGFRIILESLDALVPRCGAWRRRGFGPVIIGPFGGDIFWVAAEVENVALRDAQVFEKHPGGMRQAFRDFATKLRREVGDYFVEGGVGMAALELGDEVFAQGLVVGHES